MQAIVQTLCRCLQKWSAALHTTLLAPDCNVLPEAALNCGSSSMLNKGGASQQRRVCRAGFLICLCACCHSNERLFGVTVRQFAICTAATAADIAVCCTILLLRRLPDKSLWPSKLLSGTHIYLQQDASGRFERLRACLMQALRALHLCSRSDVWVWSAC